MLKKVIFPTLLVLFVAGCSGATDKDDKQIFVADGDYAASQIIVSYQGAQGADSTVIRSKDEARRRARELREQLKRGADFEELARRESDGAEAIAGGNLGVWSRGELDLVFESMLGDLEVGQVRDSLWETVYGYHIVRRNPLEAKYYGARAFFVTFTDSTTELAPTAERTKEEAVILLADIASRITSDNFETMANEYNDLGEGAIALGAFRRGDNIPMSFIDSLEASEFGQVTGPIEFPLGYAFLKRMRVERFAGSHILIAYEDAERAAAGVTRSKSEAETLAKELCTRLRKNPGEFEAVAREQSDGPSGVAGGSLGSWFRGNMVPEFEEAIENLEVGEITRRPVETVFGFHVIRRDDIPQLPS